ncbi:hypothetical protein [Paenibacillus sp. DRB1-1]|uniref:hypothetical protein n=1 Tax=Paenibacillus sp. DRB1-1 TaxID=3422309 RepID=UPI003F98C90E
MTDKPRNWQEDMNLCMKVDEAWSRELFIADQPDITTYWLQQYAAAESLIQLKDTEIAVLKRLAEFWESQCSDAITHRMKRKNA